MHRTLSTNAYRAQHVHVLDVECDVEERREVVHKLEGDKFAHAVPVMVSLGAVVLWRSAKFTYVSII